MQSIPQLRNLFLTALAKEKKINAPENLYEPVDYIMALGGKRLRPILCLVAAELFGQPATIALDPALGVEFFHNFTLVHDDVMDKAPLRRGAPTVHTKYDLNRAILSGDVMLIMAYEYFTKVAPEHLGATMKAFNQVAVEVCEGQQYDMDFETRDDVQVEEYIKMIALKTAVLVATSLKIGAIVSGAKEEEIENIYQFGLNIGIAFQLMDDLLDVYADQAKFGKQVGGDILNNKKTYLLITALNKAEGEHLEGLNHWINAISPNPDEKVAAVTQIYNDLGIKLATEKLMNKYYDKAFEHLNSIDVPQTYKAPLVNLVNGLMQREE